MVTSNSSLCGRGGITSGATGALGGVLLVVTGCFFGAGSVADGFWIGDWQSPIQATTLARSACVLSSFSWSCLTNSADWSDCG